MANDLSLSQQLYQTVCALAANESLVSWAILRPKVDFVSAPRPLYSVKSDTYEWDKTRFAQAMELHLNTPIEQESNIIELDFVEEELHMITSN